MKKSMFEFIILFILFTSAVSNSQYLNKPELSEKKNNSALISNTVTNNLKEPALAGFLSFILPGFGLGQAYNEQPIKTFIHTSITVACIITAFLSAGHIRFSMGGSTSNDDDSGVWPLLISVGVFTGNWAWSVADAVISANNINQKAEMKKYRSDVMNKLKLGFTVNKNKQLNLKFAFDL